LKRWLSNFEWLPNFEWSPTAQAGKPAAPVQKWQPEIFGSLPRQCEIKCKNLWVLAAPIIQCHINSVKSKFIVLKPRLHYRIIILSTGDNQ